MIEIDQNRSGLLITVTTYKSIQTFLWWYGILWYNKKMSLLLSYHPDNSEMHVSDPIFITTKIISLPLVVWQLEVHLQ